MGEFGRYVVGPGRLSTESGTAEGEVGEAWMVIGVRCGDERIGEPTGDAVKPVVPTVRPARLLRADESAPLLCTGVPGALRLMKTTTPTVVIVDLQTGNSGGFSLARDMAQTDRLRRVPILMLLERPQDEWLTHQAGVEKFCIKPVPTEELVHRALELAESHPATNG